MAEQAPSRHAQRRSLSRLGKLGLVGKLILFHPPLWLGAASVSLGLASNSRVSAALFAIAATWSTSVDITRQFKAQTGTDRPKHPLSLNPDKRTKALRQIQAALTHKALYYYFASALFVSYTLETMRSAPENTALIATNATLTAAYICLGRAISGRGGR